MADSIGDRFKKAVEHKPSHLWTKGKHLDQILEPTCEDLSHMDVPVDNFDVATGNISLLPSAQMEKLSGPENVAKALKGMGIKNKENS